MHSIAKLDNAITMTSLELVDFINIERRREANDNCPGGMSCNPPELRHDHFMVKIEKHPGIHSPKFLGQYKDSTGRTLKCYFLPKRECELMVMSESLRVQTRVYDRLKDLEAKPTTAPTATLSTLEILQLAVESEKGRLLAIEERDRAIKTKAQIGSKREATAMATAASARRETTKLRALMGEAAGSASILAVQGKLKNRAFDWRLLKSYCKTCELEMGNSWNPGIQRDVKTYPAEAWRVVYDIDLADLFGEVVA